MATDFRIRNLTVSDTATVNGFLTSNGDLSLGYINGSPFINASANAGGYLYIYGSTYTDITTDDLAVNVTNSISLNNTNITAPAQKANSASSLLTTQETVKGYLYGYMNNFRIDNLATWIASAGTGGSWTLANFGRSALSSGSTNSSNSRVRSLSPWNVNVNPYGGTPVGMTFIGYWATAGTNVMWRILSQSNDSATGISSKGYGIEISGSGSSVIGRVCAHSGAGSPFFSSWATVSSSSSTLLTQFFVWTETGKVSAAWRTRSSFSGFGWNNWSSTISTTGGPRVPDAAGTNNWNIIACENAAASVVGGNFYIYDFISTCGINQPFS